MSDKKKFSPYFYNPISYAGVLLAVLVFIIEAFLFAIDFFAHGENLYLGMLTYVALPPVLLFGLLLIPFGAWRRRRQVRKGVRPLHPEPIRIDPSIPAHRNAILVFVVGTSVLLIMSLIGAYKAFQYTESVEFCGLMCHQVMKPEHTAYLNSPHGRVKCVECHIGSGADWYVRSKLSGTRQIFRTILNSYEKPIQTPVANLRPAPETCGECHWPGKFYSTKDFRRTYFLTEGDPKRWQVRMLLNVGGGEKDAYGVHAHMNVDHDIYYAAEDAKRQKITWVKSVSKDGSETVYTTPDSKFKDTPPAPAQIRKMDCIDCHNRPTHQYAAPYRLVNEGLRKGYLDETLPDIKAKASALLEKEYKTEAEALEAIPAALAEYYRTKHPDVFASKRDAIERSAKYLQEVFAKNMFPEMKARWDRFPDNIGHLVTPGCFRCHDGEHRDTSGSKVITRDCKSCHLIIEQGPEGSLERNLDGVEFKHPLDDDNGWKEMLCSDCHTGANP